MAVVRLNISASEDVREWYKVKAEEHGMSMSALMSFVLTQYKKNEEQKEALMLLGQASQSMQHVDVTGMMGELREMVGEIGEKGCVDGQTRLSN